jgi:hypothetical protein
MSKNTNLGELTNYLLADTTNGRIGLNVATPAYSFDVAGDVNITGAFRINGVAIGTGGGGVSGSGTTNYVAKWSASTAITNSLIFDNAANVGINTASPVTVTGNTSLTINGTSVGRLDLMAGGVAYGALTASATLTTLQAVSTNPLALNTGGSERLRILTTGYIGVNTTTPAYALDTTGYGSIVANFLYATTPYIRVTDGTVITALGNDANGSYVGATSNHNFSLKANNVTYVKLLAAGRILINSVTDDTINTVQIAGTLRTTGDATVGGTAYASAFVKSSGLSSQFLKADGSVDSSTYLTTTLAASTYLTTTSAASTYQTKLTNPLTGSGTANYVARFTGSTTIGTGSIYDSGTYVGIGTGVISSGAALQVTGDVNITGNYKINGVSLAASQWTTSGSDIYNNNTGKVAIGASSTFYKFTVNTGTNLNFAIGSGTSAVAVLAHADGFNPASPVFTGFNFVASSYNFFQGFVSVPSVVIAGASYALQINGYVGGASAYYELSDIRGKNVIETNPKIDLSGLDVIKYTRKDDDKNQVHYGYSAQDVQVLCKDLVKDDGKTLTLNYSDLHTLKIAQLEERIKQLESKL